MTEIHEIPTEDLEWAVKLVRDPKFSFPMYDQGTIKKRGRIISYKEGDFTIKEIIDEMERRTAPEHCGRCNTHGVVERLPNGNLRCTHCKIVIKSTLFAVTEIGDPHKKITEDRQRFLKEYGNIPPWIKPEDLPHSPLPRHTDPNIGELIDDRQPDAPGTVTSPGCPSTKGPEEDSCVCETPFLGSNSTAVMGKHPRCNRCGKQIKYWTLASY